MAPTSSEPELILMITRSSGVHFPTKINQDLSSNKTTMSLCKSIAGDQDSFCLAGGHLGYIVNVVPPKYQRGAMLVTTRLKTIYKYSQPSCQKSWCVVVSSIPVKNNLFFYFHLLLVRKSNLCFLNEHISSISLY